MARRFAVTEIPGLQNGVVTHVDGEIVEPGDELPEGTETFDISFWYYPTLVDVQFGATPGVKIRVALRGVPVDWDDDEIRAAIMQLRKFNRQLQSFGSEGLELFADEV